MSERLHLLGLPLDPIDMEGALSWIRQRVDTGTPGQIVTLNPELVVRSRRDPQLVGAIRAAELITPDGVGILWAVRRLCGIDLQDRVTGVDLTQAAFARLGGKLRVYFLGGKPGIAERAAANSRARYGIEVAGSHHGYFDDPNEVIAKIASSGANMLLAGLGERQEVFLHAHKEELGVPVSIGVGGTLDVLAGEVRRMPEWSRRLHLEWLLRVGGDPKRWPRAIRLWKFVQLVLKEKRNNCHNP